MRRTVANHATDFGFAPIAASCHPFADSKNQPHTDKARYNQLQRDLAAIARRMLICGMHVHVGIPDQETRIELVNQLKYFLLHLHALSTSSPYWQGDDTGMNSYRLTVFDNLPRTGLPPQMDNWQEFNGTVETLVDLELIEDAPKMEVTLTLAALTQCLTRMLWRKPQERQGWPVVQNFMIEENRWRAQRYGTRESFIDFGRHALIPCAQAIDELLELIAEDAAALDCEAEVARARDIVANGTSADHQRAVFASALQGGADHKTALNAVVQSLIDDYAADL